MSEIVYYVDDWTNEVRRGPVSAAVVAGIAHRSCWIVSEPRPATVLAESAALTQWTGTGGRDQITPDDLQRLFVLAVAAEITILSIDAVDAAVAVGPALSIVVIRADCIALEYLILFLGLTSAHVFSGFPA